MSRGLEVVSLSLVLDQGCTRCMKRQAEIKRRRADDPAIDAGYSVEQVLTDLGKDCRMATIPKLSLLKNVCGSLTVN